MKSNRVFVVILADGNVPSVFTCLAGVCREHGVGKTRLSQAMNREGVYRTARLTVHEVTITKGQQRGRKVF